MSGRLVSRCSVAMLWSERRDMEATLAVSYGSQAARVCTAFSLLSFHQQSEELLPASHLSQGGDIFLGDHWSPRWGQFSSGQPT